MSNQYGFDFLKNDHRLDESGSPLQQPYAEQQQQLQPQHQHQPPPDVTHKSDLEKQHDVIKFLKNH
jgi:hypothetical protein